PGRAAAAVQRADGPDEPGRPAAGAAGGDPGEGLGAGGPGIPLPPVGEARGDRAGPAPTPGRHRPDERPVQDRLRPVLRPEPGPPARRAADPGDADEGVRRLPAADPPGVPAADPRNGGGGVPPERGAGRGPRPGSP